MLGGVFISYRRDDAPSAAWLIRNHLTQALGAETIFLDSASLQPGDEWEPALDQSVRSCVALLAIVGRAWVSPRLHEPRDFVRFEIQTALDRGVRVIPVLVDAAAMPEPEKLPDGLKVLPGRQWIKILSDDPTSGLRELSAIVGRTLRGLDKPEETVRRPAGDPKLGKEEITDLSIFVSSLIRNPNNFDNLVVSAFGEDLYNIYVPDRATGKVIPDLIEALATRGVLPQFLRAVRTGAPCSQDLERAIDKYCPSAKKNAEPINESIQIVRVGLESISRLRRNQDIGLTVKKHLVDSERLLLGLARDLKKLQAYKTLHDVLQRVQLERYGSIIEEVKRLGEAPSVADALYLHIKAVGRLCADAEEAAEVLREIGASFGPERTWIRDLFSALKELEAAVAKFDKRAARGATLTVRQILSRHPARVNSEIHGTAERLALNNLILTVSNVSSIRGLKDDEKAVLELAKIRLESLFGELGGRVSVHNQWQDVETQLWQADEEIERTPSDISEDFLLFWENANRKMSSLWELDPSAEWAKNTHDCSTQIDVLLGADPVDVESVKKKYRTFRTDALEHFFEVDKSLKSFCARIVELGPPVDSLLDS